MSRSRHLFTPMNATTRPSLHAYINAHIIKVGESLKMAKGKFLYIEKVLTEKYGKVEHMSDFEHQ